MTVEMDGSGIAKNPYRISCLEELRAVRQELDAYYKLVSDIDAKNTNNQEFKPIGDRENTFTGIFDGNDHQIANLCIKQPEKNGVGLFAWIGNGCVRNLGLTNISVTGGKYSGSLAGRNCGTIYSSYVAQLDLSGDEYIGGLVGQNYSGRVESSHIQEGDVSGESFVGGLVGWHNGVLKTSYVQGGDVSGDEVVGGLVGSNWEVVDSSCTLKVDVSGVECIGDLVGLNKRELKSSYTVDNNVLGEKYFGSLVGSGNTNRESCFTVSRSNETNIPEQPDLIMSRKEHRILYDVKMRTLFAQVNGELYSYEDVSPIEMQSLVDETEEVEITDTFKSSVVITI